MKTFTYTDYKTKQIVFQCDAENILEADKKYLEMIGKNIVQQPFIGCSIVSKELTKDFS